MPALESTEPKMMTFGDPPLKLAIYDQVVNASSVDYWNGPRTLDPETLEYVRGEKRFRNPSNYGLSALPVGLPKWRNRVLHRGVDCDQRSELTKTQKKALRLILNNADTIPNGGKTWRYNYSLNFQNMIYQPGFNSAFVQAVNIPASLCGLQNRRSRFPENGARSRTGPRHPYR